MHHVIEVLAYKKLAAADLAEYRRLCDSEHLEEFGTWDPDQHEG